MTRATFPREGTHPKHLSSRRLTTPFPRLGRVPCSYLAIWLVAGAVAAGMVTAADVGGSANLPAAGDGLAK